ncbi:hypothetical protein GCM10009840_31090 [Pseudolysinimonas kribbensis]|uniref:hypothetical protein n=1 Tax=Pseudolysinimonas kribbensis TaxID=433641 RepID=UPI0031E1627E
MAHEVAGNPIDAGTVVDHPPRRRLLPALPWIAIVAITSAVQFVREALFDGVVFGVVGLALLIDALRLVPQVGRLSRPALVPTLVGAVAVGALLAFTPRHGIVDGIVLAGLGAVVLPFAWSGVRSRTGAREQRAADSLAIRRTAVAWAVTGVATCAWELTSWILGRMLPPEAALQHPAISDILDPALDQLWFRTLFVAAWIALGLALVTRGRRD